MIFGMDSRRVFERAIGSEVSMENIEEESLEEPNISRLRIVAKRKDKDPYVVNIPVKGDTFSLVLPSGYINWPEGRPYPDDIRVKLDEEKSLWVNFDVSSNHGFYTSLNIGENRSKEIEDNVVD